MSILNIRPAKRSGSKIILGIAGQSGSGKTLTALYIARGMVSNPSEIGFLDTENKRGSLYADELDGPFMIGDLYPPFSPTRYAAAIKEFQGAGVKVLVVDSITHEWEGEGGCIDIAENTTGRIANWKLAKSEHKKFMNAALQSDMHMIVCVRAREQMDFRNPKEPRSLGVQPTCEKNFMFEMTASIMMYNEGQEQVHLKVPKDLKSVFGSGKGYLGRDVGAGIMAWVNSADQTNPELKSWENKLQACTSGGMLALAAEWSKVPKALQKKLAAHKEQCKASALAYDEASTPEDKPQAMKGFTPATPKPQPEPQPEPTAVAARSSGSAEDF